jgi:TM2 domain-containing membrane protein YozV
LTGHWKEAENLIFDLDNSRYKIADLLKMKYSYSLLMQKDYTRAGIYLSKIGDPGLFKNQYHFMKAYAEINTRQKPECIKDLDLIDNPFIAGDELTAIKNELADPAKIKKKHIGLALPMSAIVPGLGQAYSGFYFDALQSFGLNAAFGIGAYSAWKYELSKGKTNRNYVLPSLSTLILSAFYITNLFNSVNVTQKANLYSENQYYRKIANRFDIVLDRNQYFIRFKIDLKPAN